MSTVSQKKMAPRKSLHSGRSLWADARTTRLALKTAVPDRLVEVAIVGGGISGAITALVLSAAGHDVVVVDRRQPGSGSTVASTAMIQFELDMPLTTLAKKIGKTDAVRAYRRSLKAVADLCRLIEDHGLDAALVERDALYLAGNVLGSRALEEEARARRAAGLPSSFLSKTEVAEQFGIVTTGAIVSRGSAEIDPARTAAACLAAAQCNGAEICSPCEVVAIETSHEGVVLALKSGERLRSRKVIVATGYEVIDGLPRDDFDIVSSWAVATKPVDPSSLWPSRCLIWEAAKPYLYLRTTADDRILVGGEDSGLRSADRRRAAIPAKGRTLLAKASKLLRRDDLEIDYAWGGCFADSPTGLPLIRPLSGMPDVLAILGCGGNGITFSVIASDIAKAWMRGRRDRDASLFAGLPRS